MDENDLLVLFYSGHGPQDPRRISRDADGIDETLTLYDGDYIDDDLDELLSAHTGILLVLDACFSGGFAKDVISRLYEWGSFPRRRRHSTGSTGRGYLSVFFLEACRETADVDHNRQITALELSQYMNAGTEVQEGGKSSRPASGKQDDSNDPTIS